MDTIAAITTQGAKGGVGMIRLSGPDALPISRSIFSSLPKDPQARYLYFGHFRSSRTQEPLDSGLLVWMQSPKSFTGEDVVEIHCHGGDLNQSRMLRAVLEAGARLAERGEFTRRAFLNDKMDLAQAEALMDVVNAETQSGLKAAHHHLQGALSEAIEASRKEMLQVISHIEVNIDFLQEDVPLFDPEDLAKRIDSLGEGVHTLLATYAQGKVLRDGLTVALAGPPNAGKSSLFNALLQEQRAIVTEIPGTTRDYLEEKLDLENLPILLIDTAGVREALDPIEREGVARSHQRIAKADLTLLLLDRTLPAPESPNEILPDAPQDKIIVLATKSDKEPHSSWTGVDYSYLSISAHRGDGIQELLSQIRSRYGLTEERVANKAMITRARHHAALERTHVALLLSAEALRGQLPFEIVAGELQLALEAVGEIVGATTTDDILNHIFKEFCIGK